MNKHYVVVVVVFLLLLTGACGGKKTSVETPTRPTTFTIEDERTFPQDLTYYAKQAGSTKALLTLEEQERAHERFLSIFFGPWSMEHGITKSGEACLRKARGYKLGGERWPQAEWDDIVVNANMGSFPSTAQPAIILRNTDLRQMPTHEPRYDKPIVDAKSYPFDDFQYSLLPLGMPVFLTHTSADGRWKFVETPLASGWIDANDVAPVDHEFMQLWRQYPLGAIVVDNIPLPKVGTPLTIGTVLPLASQGKKSTVLFPVAGKGEYATIKKMTRKSAEIKSLPLRLTPIAMATLMKSLYGQPYGWGAMYGLRDCSTTTHDLLVPFGIWLPRNSRGQARTGRVINLAGLGHAEKEETIKRYGVPFLSLLGLSGHITMYVGTYNGRVAILHNVWGVRTVEGENDNARHIIGKTLVTSLTPGAELPDLYRKRTFIDRVRALATPGAQ